MVVAGDFNVNFNAFMAEDFTHGAKHRRARHRQRRPSDGDQGALAAAASQGHEQLQHDGDRNEMAENTEGASDLAVMEDKQHDIVTETRNMEFVNTEHSLLRMKMKPKNTTENQFE